MCHHESALESYTHSLAHHQSHSFSPIWATNHRLPPPPKRAIWLLVSANLQTCFHIHRKTEFTADLIHGQCGIMRQLYKAFPSLWHTIRATLIHQSGLPIECIPTESLLEAACKCQPIDVLCQIHRKIELTADLFHGPCGIMRQLNKAIPSLWHTIRATLVSSGTIRIICICIHQSGIPIECTPANRVELGGCW